MGWDAYSEERKRNDPEWEKALERVLSVADGVDGLLSEGALDCSNCAYALQEATGESVWTDAIWSADMVKRLAKDAVWPDLYYVEKNKRWAVASAKEFLETAAKIESSVYFSF